MHSFPDGVEGGVKNSHFGPSVLIGPEVNMAAEVFCPFEIHAALRHGTRGDEQPGGGVG